MRVEPATAIGPVQSTIGVTAGFSITRRHRSSFAASSSAGLLKRKKTLAFTSTPRNTVPITDDVSPPSDMATTTSPSRTPACSIW